MGDRAISVSFWVDQRGLALAVLRRCLSHFRQLISLPRRPPAPEWGKGTSGVPPEPVPDCKANGEIHGPAMGGIRFAHEFKFDWNK